MTFSIAKSICLCLIIIGIILGLSPFLFAAITGNEAIIHEKITRILFLSGLALLIGSNIFGTFFLRCPSCGVKLFTGKGGIIGIIKFIKMKQCPNCFKDLAITKIQPEIFQNATPSTITDDDDNFQIAHRLNSSLRYFTINYPKRAWISVLVGIFALVIVVIITGILLYVDSDYIPDESDIILLYSLSAIFFITIVSLCYYVYRLKKWSVEVSGNKLNITPILGESRTVYFNEITKVKVFPPVSFESFSGFFVIKLYSNGKRLLKIYNNFNGCKELVQRLKAEKIPFR
jgi:hypothetical protein